METWQLLKNLLLIIVLAVVGFVGYICYRYYEASKFENIAITTGRYPPGTGFPPIICSYGAKGFSGISEEHAYFSDGKTRFDATVLAYDQTVIGHSIALNSQEEYDWTDASLKGTKGTVAEMEAAALARPAGTHFADLETAVNLSCSPWWFPDDSLFQIPSDITFTPITSGSQ